MLKSRFFLITRHRRFQPPSQAGVRFGLRVRSHVFFGSGPIPREIKLRRKKGQALGGVTPDSFFMSASRGSAAFRVLSAHNGVFAREIEPSE